MVLSFFICRNNKSCLSVIVRRLISMNTELWGVLIENRTNEVSGFRENTP
jgi:hypothetical protein